MSINREFESIEILLRNPTPTMGVDCFALSVIKMERQLRRLFTYSVFQFSCFGKTDIPHLRQALVDQKNAYFEGFIHGMDAIHPASIAELVGEQYSTLFPIVQDAISCRNKIFHGQLTDRFMNTKELLSIVSSIRAWCEQLGNAGKRYFDYAGFSSSFCKANDSTFVSRYKITLSSIQEYEQFLIQHVKRRR